MSDVKCIKNYQIYRKTLTNANTEYSQALAGNVPLMIRISLDDLTSTARISFTALASGTGRQIFQGGEWRTPGFLMGQKTVYAQSPNAAAILIIETWEKA